MFFLPSLPIDCNDESSIESTFKIFLLNDFALLESNKKPVFSLGKIKKNSWKKMGKTKIVVWLI